MVTYIVDFKEVEYNHCSKQTNTNNENSKHDGEVHRENVLIWNKMLMVIA